MPRFFERKRFAEAMDAFFPSEVIPLASLVDCKEDYYAISHAVDLVDFKITLGSPNPDSGECEAWIPYIFDYGAKNEADVLRVATEPAGGGTVFTKVSGSGPVNSSQVRIYPQLERFDFHADHADSDIYFTGKVVCTPVSANFLRRVWVELHALETTLKPIVDAGSSGNIMWTAQAAEDIGAGRFATLNSSGQWVYAGVTEESLRPFAFIADGISNGATGTGLVTGMSGLDFSGLSHGLPIYLVGTQGQYTQSLGDLDDYDLIIEVGRAIGAERALVNCAGIAPLLKKDIPT